MCESFGRPFEELEERGNKFREDEVDLAEELVGSDLGSPLLENRVGCLEDSNIDVVIGERK